MYEIIKTEYYLRHIDTEWVCSNTDVTHGYILSSTLFVLYAEELTIRVRQRNLGIKVRNKTLSLLIYAGDIVIMSETSEKLQKNVRCRI